MVGLGHLLGCQGQTQDGVLFLHGIRSRQLTLIIDVTERT